MPEPNLFQIFLGRLNSVGLNFNKLQDKIRIHGLEKEWQKAENMTE